jgi:ferredoxin
MGSGAISTVGRGTGKKVSTPYDESSGDCIGCGACAKVCPVGAIELTGDDKTRTIWNKTFSLVQCEKCGAPYGTEEELALLKTKLDPHKWVNLNLCPDCRKRIVLSNF